MFKRLLLIVFFVFLTGCSTLDITPQALLSNRRPKNFLTDHYYSRLSVELIEVEGMSPTQDDINLLKTRIEEHCNKPDGIVFYKRPVPRSALPANPIWTGSALGDFRDTYATRHTSGSDLVLHILFIPGRDEDDPGGQDRTVGGMTFDSDVFAIYSERRGVATLGAMMVHEMGHIFGLVGEGASMVNDHESGPEGGHCDNKYCAMFWIQVTGRPDFDEACRADLKASGGR